MLSSEMCQFENKPHYYKAAESRCQFLVHNTVLVAFPHTLL